jgi:hypothetical protein
MNCSPLINSKSHDLKVIVFVSILLLPLWTVINFIPTDVLAQIQILEGTSNTTTLDEVSQFDNETIMLTAINIGVEGVPNYVWMSEGTTNPTLNVLPNTTYNVVVQSLPEDEEEHELIIETLDEVRITQSEEVGGGSFDEIAFDTDEPTVIRYYCEYHPTSMLGIINIGSAGPAAAN